MRVWDTYDWDMKFRLTALLVVVALMWAGFASSSFACHNAPQEMTVSSTDHHQMAMDDMEAMHGCPSHMMGTTMKMDASKCAVACYGLVSPVAFEPIQYGLGQAAFHESVTEQGSQLMASLVSGVPTPPPNFA